MKLHVTSDGSTKGKVHHNITTLQTGVGEKVMSNVRQRKTLNSEAKENKAKEQKNGSSKINKKETENKG